MWNSQERVYPRTNTNASGNVGHITLKQRYLLNTPFNRSPPNQVWCASYYVSCVPLGTMVYRDQVKQFLPKSIEFTSHFEIPTLMIVTILNEEKCGQEAPVTTACPEGHRHRG